MVWWVVLAVLSAEPAPCPVELDVTVLEPSAPSPEAFRQALQAELGRDVVLARAAQCDQVAIAIDVGVVTITVRGRESEEQKRVLVRAADTQVVRESVLLAAGLLRSQLAEHLRNLAAASIPPPSPAPVTQAPLSAPPAWWINVNGLLGITAMGIIATGFEAAGQRKLGVVRLGLSASYTFAVEGGRTSSRVQLFPEIGAYGGPWRARFGLFLGAGPLIMHELDGSGADVDTYVVLFAFRPRVVFAVSILPEVDLQLTGGLTLAKDSRALPRDFLYGALALSYGLGPW